MKQAVKEKLVAALRSGNYKQGRNRLKSTGRDGATRHCCLGVLCEIYTQEKEIKEGFAPAPSTKYTGADKRMTVHAYGRDREVAMPPKAIRNWAGLDLRSAEQLAEMNDGRKSFKQIADYISASL